MRALPPPRKSRARALRRFLHRLYRFLTLQFILNRKKSILVRKRRTPFHFSSRKYKVKLPKRHTSSHRNFLFKKTPRFPVSTAVLGDRSLNNQFPGSQVEYKPVGRRSRMGLSNIDRRFLRRAMRKMIYKLYSPRRHRGLTNLNLVVDI